MQIHTFARSAALIAFAVLGLVAVPQATHAQDDLYPEERVARIAVDPSVIEVRVGESVPVTIAPVDADGNVMRDILMRVTARGSGAWYDAARPENHRIGWSFAVKWRRHGGSCNN